MVSSYDANSLPESERLPVERLAGLFRNTTTSYKYLFFLALISELERQSFHSGADPWISLESLGAEMLTIAWYPHMLFRLSFGAQDKVAAALKTNPLPQSVKAGRRRDQRNRLRAHFQIVQASRPLLRYVPQRLLHPFFTKELGGVKDSRRDERIVRLAEKRFIECRPLYRFAEDRTSIVLHLEWFSYLVQNISIVKEWALWEWLQYMQSRNPNTPNVPAKLLPPGERNSLSREREFWNFAIRSWPSNAPLNCPYSGRPIVTSRYALDHFLPWTFVAHDRLWNLVPADRQTNSQKSDKLPHQKYLDSLVHMHATALRTVFQGVEDGSIGERVWHNRVEDYISDLHLHGEEDLLRIDKLREAYYSEVSPLLALAKAQGFQPHWVAEVA